LYLGQELRRIRLGKGVSLEEAASHIGITRQYLSYLEKGERKSASFEITTRISEYYEVPLDYLKKFSQAHEEQMPVEELQLWYKHNENVREQKMSRAVTV
jgi:transcriptional regulator with XRE-family HTH domain